MSNSLAMKDPLSPARYEADLSRLVEEKLEESGGIASYTEIAGPKTPIRASSVSTDPVSGATNPKLLNLYEGVKSNARQIGALGSLPFLVSSRVVQTLDNAEWEGSANYAEHKRISGTTLVEATGSDADKFSFDIFLSAHLGINPWDALSYLLTAMRQQTFLTLTIGDHAYGRYRWLIASLKIKLKEYAPNGNLTGALVSIKLVEYLRE